VPLPSDAAQAAAQRLSLRMFSGMLATQESFIAYLGVKLGLYQALHDGGPATARQLASRAGLALRYVREWLEHQAAAGIITVDDPARPWQLRSYRLPPGHEQVLTAAADSQSAVWTAVLPLGGVAAALPSLLAAFRTGEGIRAEVFGEDWRQGHGGANRAIYVHQLASWLRQHVADIHQRLSGGPSRIADIGCGEGWAAIALALAYPDALITAVDLDEVAVVQARRRASEAGLADRTRFLAADAASLAGGVASPAGETAANGEYDLVCVFDVLHEVAHPVEVLRSCRRLCGAAGAVLVLESRVGDNFRAPGDEIERFQYATSVLHCLPAGLVGDGAAGTGTVMRPDAVRSVARQAGFSEVLACDLDDRLHRLYRLQ
jgi:2-polyprenyl-3-methyl-5-hydroxy-6-metoxy-1,4-benzoquinol methylase